MTYVYSNNEFDPRSISMIGLSAKEAGSIGRFGTGLKYSIAYFMREKVPFTLTVDGTPYQFELRQDNFRGTDFEAIHMNGSPLPFTTNYAKDWKLWQVYRELVSNAYDEHGGISSTPVSARVVFHVPSFAEIPHESIFLSTDPIWATEAYAIHPGDSGHVYYRGIRAGQAHDLAPLKINAIGCGALSENREFGGIVGLAIKILTDVVSESAMPADVRQRVLGMSTLDYEWKQLSDSITMCSEFERLIKQKAACISALRYYRNRKEELALTDPIALDSFGKKSVREALTIVNLLYPDATKADFIFCQQLPKGALGAFEPKTNNIYISLDTFERGYIDLAATMLEELMHREEGYADETRAFQDFLLRKLTLELAKREPDMSSISKSPAAFNDVKFVLDKALEIPGLRYTFKELGGATRFKLRCNQYRQLLREIEAEQIQLPGHRPQTAYDSLIIRQQDEEGKPSRRGLTLVFDHIEVGGTLIDPKTGKEILLPGTTNIIEE